MKIAVIGAATNCQEDILIKSFELGKEIAKRKIDLLVGGCRGYPHEAAKGASKEGGKVLAYSPGKDEKEHTERYNFPLDGFTSICYTGLGVPRRNYPLVSEADAVIMIGGQIGSLNEFTIAHHFQKKIGILTGSGGITNLIEKIVEVCEKDNESKKIVYNDDFSKLLDSIENL
ncbi:hypothetical protein ACFLZX_02460 [Nanoarchaeota archaeon]